MHLWKARDCLATRTTELISNLERYNWLASDLKTEGKRTQHPWGALLLLESPGQRLFSVTHLQAAKRVLRYLKGRPNIPLLYQKGDLGLVGYCDSSYGAADPDLARSSSGFIYFLGKGVIHFGSKLQRLTAQSSTESELIALAHTAKEGRHISALLGEIGVRQAMAFEIRVDNMGSILLAEGAKYSPRTKHFGVRYHALQQLINDGHLKPKFVSSANQLADLLTKHLSRHALRSAINAIELY